MHLLKVLKHHQAYCLYNEENKKFIFSRDVIFLEMNKNDESIERHIDHPEYFPINKNIMKLVVKFHILKVGSLSYINLLNFLLASNSLNIEFPLRIWTYTMFQECEYLFYVVWLSSFKSGIIDFQKCDHRFTEV